MIDYSDPRKPTVRFSLSLYGAAWVAVVFVSLLFYVDEYKRATAMVDLLPLKENYVPVSCEALAENDNQLVHIDCPLHKLHTFHPPPEFARNLKPFQGVFFDMKVEMYQWVWRPRFLHFGFEGSWSSNLVDTTGFPFLLRHTHVNPEFFPYVNGAGRRFAPKVYIGDFVLSRRHVLKFREKRQLGLVNDGIYVKSQERPCTSISYRNTQVYNNALFTGDPNSPQVGDLRITFWGSTASHISAMGQQVRVKPSHALAGSHVELKPFLNNATKRVIPELVYEGDRTPERMFQDYIDTREHNNWLGRLVLRGTFLLAMSTLVLLTKVALQAPCHGQSASLMTLAFGSLCFAWGCILITLIPFRVWYDTLETSWLFIWGLVFIMSALGLWRLDSRAPSPNETSDTPLLETHNTSKLLDKNSLIQCSQINQHVYQPV